MRVCIVRQRDVYEPQIQRVAEALTRAGYEVEVLCMRGKGQPRTTEVNGVRITGLRASLARGNKLRYVFDYGDSLYLPPMQYAEVFGSYTEMPVF